MSWHAHSDRRQGKKICQIRYQRAFYYSESSRRNPPDRGKQRGFEPNVFDVDFTSRKQVLHIRLISIETLLNRAEAALDSLEWNEAETALIRASKTDDEDSRYLSLMGAFTYRTGDYEAALLYWKALLHKGHRDPYLYLLIADTWQYGLEDLEEAEIWLKKYLKSREDSKVRKRLNELTLDEEQ